MTRTKALVVLLVIVILSAGFADFQVSKLGGRVSAQSQQALSLAREIQVQRVDLIRDGCKQQNKHHAATIAELDRQLRRIARHDTPAQRKQLRASRLFTVLLIDQLAPYQDCRIVVSQATAKTR